MSDEEKRGLADRLSLLLSGDAVLLRTEFAKNTLREAIAALQSDSEGETGESQ